MCLQHILLVVAATLLACSGATSVAADQTKLLKVQTPNLAQPNDAILNNKDSRLLRVHDVNAGDEERAVNLRNIFDFKQRFGMGKNSAANVAVRKSSTAKNAIRKNTANYAANANNIGNDFAMVNLEKMLNNPAFKEKMFKRWDKVTMEEIKLKIGEVNLNKKKLRR